jgi:magnesium transporter
MIVNNAIYVDGRRVAEPHSLQETRETRREYGGIAWIGVYKPTKEEFELVAEEFGLHPLAVEDVIEAHQRPKLERYGETLFVVLKAARYLDESETVVFGEIHVFIGKNFVVTVRHGEAPALGEVRRRLEATPELLRRGPAAILHAIMDQVVDGYAPVVAGLENDIDEIESEVFGGNPGVSRRIYELSREVIEFQRAAEPLAGVLEYLTEDQELGVDLEVRRYMRDVRDHALRVTERVDGFRGLLSDILRVNHTLVDISQSDQTKKISAWAAILFAPALVAGIYGITSTTCRSCTGFSATRTAWG